MLIERTRVWFTAQLAASEKVRRPDPIASSVFSRTLSTVSYTHLDVYKRQVGDLVALAAKVENIATAVEARRALESEERAQAREAATARRLEIVETAERIASQPEEKIQWKASSAQTVSYTHLDVYKRQPDDYVMCGPSGGTGPLLGALRASRRHR